MFKAHLEKRGLTDKISAWISYEEEIVRFPIWTLDGKLIGYQRYNWQAGKLRSNNEWGRYITKVNDAYKAMAFWGAEHFYNSEEIFYTEGIWNAIRIINAGYAALALLTCSPHKQLRSYLKLINKNRRTIVICDKDDNKAGEKLKHVGDEHYFPPAPDINDMNQNDANLWLNQIVRT